MDIADILDLITLRPADLGSTANDYIGRSQFSNDPYLDGDVDEFRIYNRAFSPEEMQALASGSGPEGHNWRFSIWHLPIDSKQWQVCH